MLMSKIHTANATAAAAAADGEECNFLSSSLVLLYMKNVLKSKADATLTYVRNCHFDRIESAVNNFFYVSRNCSIQSHTFEFVCVQIRIDEW